MNKTAEKLLEDMAKASSQVWSQCPWNELFDSEQTNAIAEVQAALRVLAARTGIVPGAPLSNAVDTCVLIRQIAFGDYSQPPDEERALPRWIMGTATDCGVTKEDT